MVPSFQRSVSIMHCRILSVFFTLQDTVTLILTTGSSTAISQSIFLQHNPWRSIWPPCARLYTVGLVACRPNTVYVSGGIGHPPQAARSSSSVKESAVAALSATLYQCGPTLGAKVCHQYYYSPGFNKVTLQSTHWNIQTLFISGGDSSCSWVFCSCTGPQFG